MARTVHRYATCLSYEHWISDRVEVTVEAGDDRALSLARYETPLRLESRSDQRATEHRA